MNDVPDAELLQQFARNQSEAAFAELVQRYIGIVYSTAFRKTNNPQNAEDITQAVFIILARKAASLSPKTVLPGWLYHTARLTAANLQRAELRRIRREQEVFMQSTQPSESSSDTAWSELSPLLEDAMAGLGTSDRDAIVLRFFQNRSMVDVGTALGASEGAAKMRVSRALEKLRKFYKKRGVVSTTAIIAGAISSNSVQAAPATLAKAVTLVAMAKGATASASTLTLVKGALKTMTLQKIKIAAVVGVLLFLAAGTTTLGVEHATKPSSSVRYRTADDFWRLIKSVNTNRLIIGVSITSRNKAVRREDVCLIIHSAKGPILVHLSANGSLTNFPDDEALRRENPDVTVNQPKNTMNLNVWYRVPASTETTFNYSDLVGSVDEARRTFAKMNGIVTPGNVGWMNYFEWLFMPTPKVHGLVIAFPKSSARKATMKILAGGQAKTYQADARGMIRFILDPALLQEDPQVTFSEKPLWMVPEISVGSFKAP